MRYIVKFWGGDVFECKLIERDGVECFVHVLNSSYIIRADDMRIESFKRINEPDPSVTGV